MQAKEGVIDRLNELLTIELTAVNQYILQAAMCENWGYARLAHKLRELSLAEMQDLKHLVTHILYLDGLPNMQRLGSVQVGESPQEHLQLSLEGERRAVDVFREAIGHMMQVADFTTRNLLEEMVRDEEQHVDWLETQLEAIRRVGVELYLTEQIRE